MLHHACPNTKFGIAPICREIFLNRRVSYLFVISVHYQITRLNHAKFGVGAWYSVDSMAADAKKAICVILAYNCARTLENTFRRIPLETVDRIVLIDDASTDNTLEVARRLGIESYTHEHLGYGGNVKYSIRKGIELGADYIIDLHGDGQYDPGAIPLALAKAREGYDFVLGSRFVDRSQPLRDGMSWARYLANIGLSTIERVVLDLPLSEFHTGFRIYTKHLAETVALDATSDAHLFSFEIIAQARFCNLRIGEVPIRCGYKEEHTSISLPKAALYSLQTFKTLALFLLARAGFKIALFSCKKAQNAS